MGQYEGWPLGNEELPESFDEDVRKMIVAALLSLKQDLQDYAVAFDLPEAFMYYSANCHEIYDAAVELGLVTE